MSGVRDAHRLAAAACKLTREANLAASWYGKLTEFGYAQVNLPWLEQLAGTEMEYRQRLEIADGERSALLPAQDSPPPTSPPSIPSRQYDDRPRGGVPYPQLPADPQAVWNEYEYRWLPVGVDLSGDPVVDVDGNLVCVVRRCGHSGHQPGAGVHAYVLWAGSGAVLAERHAAAPVRPVAEPYSSPELYSATLIGDSVLVGLSSGLLVVPLRSGQPKLLTQGDGLPGRAVKAVESHGGMVYLALSGDGGVLASWDPVSNRFSVIAAEKAISTRNMLDGVPFDLTALVGDPINRCVWLGGDGPTADGPALIGVWRYDPAARTITRATDEPAPFLPVTLAKDRHLHREHGTYFFAPHGGWFDLSYYSRPRSTVFDGRNVIDVMLDTNERDARSMVTTVARACLVRRGEAPELFAALPDGTRFPEPVCVHGTAAGVLAVMEDGRVGLISRKDMKQTYLNAECLGSGGSADETRLLRAAAGGDLGELRRLLDAGTGTEVTDGEGKTALMYAARERQTAAAALLLKRGASALAVSTGGVSVLAFAAQGGDTGMAVRLLRMAPDVSGRSRTGMTPLLYAAAGGHADMLRLLLANGANRDETDSDGRNGLCLAIERQSAAAVDCLLRSGMNPNAPGWRGLAPLVLASERDNMEIVRMMCMAGANTAVVAPSPSAWEPALPLLAKGARAGQTALVKTLLQAGANAEILDYERSTPLIHGSFMGRLDVVRALLDAGANIEAENKWECRPLILAVYKRHPEVARLLIERKASVNRQDNHGNTPLHAAASTKQWDIVKLLLANGADPKIKNKKGEPAMVQEK